MTQTLKKGGTFTKEIKLSTATQSSKEGGTFTIQKNGQLIIEQNIFEIIIWSAWSKFQGIQYRIEIFIGKYLRTPFWVFNSRHSNLLENI